MLRNLPAVVAESELSSVEALQSGRAEATHSITRELVELLSAASAAGVVFGTADIVRAALAVPSSVSFGTGMAVLGLWLWFAQLLGVVTWSARNLAAKVRRSVDSRKAELALLTLCLGLVGLALVRRFIADGGVHRGALVRAHAPWALTFMAALGAGIALRFRAAGKANGLDQRSLRIGLIASSITLALSAVELDARLAGGYLYIHVLLLTFAVVVSTYAVELTSLPGLVKRGALIITIVSAPSVLAFPASRGARELLVQPTWAGVQLVEYAQYHLDFDHDGHSIAFGGNDCDDSDASTYVGAAEKPGDGRDSDCNGADDPKPSELAFEPFTGLQEGAQRHIAERAKRLPTLVVLIDALRFDRVGNARFPNLAQLARESLQYTQVYATSSTTLSSVPAMMSGHVRVPPGRDNIAQAIGRAGQSSRFVSSDALWTHFRRLGSQNPLTSFTSSELVGAENASLWGKNQSASNDEQISASAIRHLSSDRPSELLWLHYFGLHEWASSSGFLPLGGEEEKRYDAALEILDRNLAPLLALRDRFAVVLLADHGEGLGERGIKHHAGLLFQELAHVPMLIRVPGVEPTTIDMPLGSTCVFNTLRALRGLDADPAAAPSLLQFVGASNVGQGPGFAAFETSQWSLLYGTHRLLYTPRQQLLELYDLRLDPSERKNRADENPWLASQLLGHLTWLRNDSAR